MSRSPLTSAPSVELGRWDLLFARDAVTASGRTRLAHLARSGDLVRVTRGAYARAADWQRLDDAARLRAMAHAVAETTREELTFSHATAAALWRLPWWGAWPARVDAVTAPPSTVGSTRAIRRHVEAAGSVDLIDGLKVTSLARTVVDIARGADLLRGVIVADAALNSKSRAKLALAATTVDDLVRELPRVPLRHGAARVRYVVDFADGRSGSPGESVSRVTIDRLELPPPVLQRSFPNPAGGFWDVDFWWEEFGVIGEFDGTSKYLDAALRAGKTAEQIVFEEKLREDALRRQASGFARWGWPEAPSPPRLGARLRDAGLPVRRLQSL